MRPKRGKPDPMGGAARPARTERGRRAAHALALLLLVLTASTLVHCEAIAPRQSWSRRWGPMVPHKTFPGDCSLCHYPAAWDHIKEDFEFDHGEATGHVLEGAHATAACLRCHNDRGPVALYQARGCAGCHVDVHQGSQGITCNECHDQVSWDPVGLIADHARTRFPLLGMHATVACESCHDRAPAGEYRGTPAECHLCHQLEVDQGFPNHRVNGWIRDCQTCHTPLAWETPGFDHSPFPLIGGHANLDCLQCHAGGQVRPTPTDCFFCHQPDYVAAPDHVAQSFPTDCAQCHNIFDFSDTQ